MRLTCLRHGVTPLNLAHRFNGMSQEGITEPQREALAKIDFDHSAFDAIYCSNLNRTIETAMALGIASWITDVRIAERNLGVFEGLTDSECEKQHPRAYKAFKLLDADFVIPGGESRSEHLSRVLAWLEEAARHNNVLAVTHGGTMDFLIRLGTGIPVHGGEEIYGGANASITTFQVDWPDVQLLEAGITL